MRSLTSSIRWGQHPGQREFGCNCCPQMSLTAAFVKNCKPENRARRYFDGRGLYLEVSPKGGKWWRLKYRFGGKEKRISLGTYPDVSLGQARERRENARKQVADGIDPSEHRKALKLSGSTVSKNTFEVVAREWFAKRESNWAENYSGRLIRRLEKDIFPFVGKESIADVSATQLLDAIQRIENRGAIETAHRTLANCSEIFRYARATGRAATDVATDLKGALAQPIKTHFAATVEPNRLGEILRMIRSYKGTAVVSAAMRFAPYVFVRPGELRHARWADIDFTRQRWSFALSKTGGDHIVPLAAQSIQILAELEPLTGRYEYVFPSARSPKRPMSDNALLAAMRRLGIPKEEMSVHGFRATARTLLDEELGVRPDFIEHQLGHAVRDPQGRAYNRTQYLSDRSVMMQTWADYLDHLCSFSEKGDGMAAR